MSVIRRHCKVVVSNSNLQVPTSVEMSLALLIWIRSEFSVDIITAKNQEAAGHNPLCDKAYSPSHRVEKNFILWHLLCDTCQCPRLQTFKYCRFYDRQPPLFPILKCIVFLCTSFREGCRLSLTSVIFTRVCRVMMSVMLEASWIQQSSP